MRFLILLLLASCSDAESDVGGNIKNKESIVSDELDLRCKKIKVNMAFNWVRCENSEVICYAGPFSKSGISCRWKDEKARP